MSDYIKSMTARQVIEMIANQYYELSNDKIKFQRDDHVRWCKEWLKANPDKSMLEGLEEVRTTWSMRKEDAE